MQIRTATLADLDQIMDIYAAARRYMAASGNPNQWGTTKPTREEMAETVAQGVCRIGVDEAGIPHFAFTLYDVEDPTYQQIYEGAWPNAEPYLTIHRVASDGTQHGMFAACLAYVRSRAAEAGIRNIRIDTHQDNKTMQYVIAKAGFGYCGIIHLANGDPRLAYQLVLED